LVSFENVNNVIGQYLSDGAQDQSVENSEEWNGNEGDENIRIFKTAVYPGDKAGGFHTGTDIFIEIEGEVLKPILGLVMGFTLWSQFEYELAYMLFDDDQSPPVSEVKPGLFRKRFKIPANSLAEGEYKIQFDIGIHMLKRIVNNECNLAFTLVNVSGNGRRFTVNYGTRGRSSILRPSWYVAGDE